MRERARAAHRGGCGLVHEIAEALLVCGRQRTFWACGGMAHEIIETSEPADCPGCGVVGEARRLGHADGSRSVYYVKADRLIKIGVSDSPGRRALALKGDLLAVEPSPPKNGLERRRHAEFDHLRVRGEFFRPAPELLRHIESLRTAA